MPFELDIFLEKFYKIQISSKVKNNDYKKGNCFEITIYLFESKHRQLQKQELYEIIKYQRIGFKSFSSFLCFVYYFFYDYPFYCYPLLS